MSSSRKSSMSYDNSRTSFTQHLAIDAGYSTSDGSTRNTERSWLSEAISILSQEIAEYAVMIPTGCYIINYSDPLPAIFWWCTECPQKYRMCEILHYLIRVYLLGIVGLNSLDEAAMNPSPPMRIWFQVPASILAWRHRQAWFRADRQAESSPAASDG